MKTSPNGRALGPQVDAYRVAVQGDSEPVIVTPGGRVLRVQQLGLGGWGPEETHMTAFFVEAANMLREKNRAEWAREEEELRKASQRAVGQEVAP